VRILYDRYIDLANLDALSTQRVIFPEVVDLTAAQNAVMEGIVDEANALGFDISCLGDNSWTLNGMPSVMNDVNPRELMLSMIDTVVDGSGKIADDLRHNIALSMARAAAIKPGRQLTSAEMEQMFKLTTPNYTPDGKIIITIIAIDDIARLFA
jgi:DNA mismatch repair protein MutL